MLSRALTVLGALIHLIHGQSSVSVCTVSATTCASSSALSYTSGTSTFVLSAYTSSRSSQSSSCFATTTLPGFTTTVFAANTSQCTISASPVTVTIYQSSEPSLIVDGNFERGNTAAWQMATNSGSEVSGNIMQGPPLDAYSGSNY